MLTFLIVVAILWFILLVSFEIKDRKVRKKEILQKLNDPEEWCIRKEIRAEYERKNSML
jgi:hypothetical protein